MACARLDNVLLVGVMVVVVLLTVRVNELEVLMDVEFGSATAGSEESLMEVLEDPGSDTSMV
jgi:hypothetical protein